MKKFLKQIKDFLEYLVFLGFMKLFKRINIDKSAEICSKIARKIGPYLKATKVARKNLQNILGSDDSYSSKIIDGLWDNFGRFIGEFPHIEQLTDEEIEKHVEIVGLEELQKLVLLNQPFLLFTGHFANWDFVSRVISKIETKFAIIYRRANNPFVDKAITEARFNNNVKLIAKGANGARNLLKAIKAGSSIIMLIDQKMNDGISVPFFGRPAMTAPAIAKIALQYGYPILPCQIIRKEGSYFKIIIYPPINYANTGNIEADSYNIMVKINNIIEKWVRENPSQWFWFHNRWGKGE